MRLWQRCRSRETQRRPHRRPAQPPHRPLHPLPLHLPTLKTDGCSLLMLLRCLPPHLRCGQAQLAAESVSDGAERLRPNPPRRMPSVMVPSSPSEGVAHQEAQTEPVRSECDELLLGCWDLSSRQPGGPHAATRYAAEQQLSCGRACRPPPQTHCPHHPRYSLQRRPLLSLPQLRLRHVASSRCREYQARRIVNYPRHHLRL
mmetsp:Transcript_35266/g.92553  ORF Transcript_35266/g.92553 Transcript_35266/m.92553 type:complete len:202 (-) Transcript_35266:232-837(-)